MYCVVMWRIPSAEIQYYNITIVLQYYLPNLPYLPYLPDVSTRSNNPCQPEVDIQGDHDDSAHTEPRLQQ